MCERNTRGVPYVGNKKGSAMDSDMLLILVNFVGVVLSLMTITLNPRGFVGWILLIANGGAMIVNGLNYAS